MFQNDVIFVKDIFDEERNLSLAHQRLHDCLKSSAGFGAEKFEVMLSFKLETAWVEAEVSPNCVTRLSTRSACAPLRLFPEEPLS